MLSHPSPHPDWLAALRASADVPPLRPRVPLCCGVTEAGTVAGAGAGLAVIGSVEPHFLDQIDLKPSSMINSSLLKIERHGVVSWHLQGDITQGLNAVAAALQQAGLGGAWRNEQLAVLDQQGRQVGTVERAAVRPLGIATAAVHLVGFAPDGRVWVQQRALTKANDPGLWDTLMGGMVSAADSLQTALARETWEEAGLRLAQLQAMAYGGRITTRRPALDGQGVSDGAGYVQEHIDWFRCTLPEGVVPVNQDGEVAQFVLLEPAELVAQLERDLFTNEAALILVDALGW